MAEIKYGKIKRVKPKKKKAKPKKKKVEPKKKKPSVVSAKNLAKAVKKYRKKATTAGGKDGSGNNKGKRTKF